MSEKLINRQIKFTSHLLGAEESDITKTRTIDHNVLRMSAGLKEQVDLGLNGTIR